MSDPTESAASATDHHVVVGDTDALLCFGHAGKDDGISVLWRRYHKNGAGILIPRQVGFELRTKAQGNGPLKSAAGRLAAPRAAPFIRTDTTPWGKAERREVREKVEEAERRKAELRGREPKLHGHDGEVEAILLARRENAILVSNDKSARAAARDEGVRSATFAMVLAAEVRDGQLLAEDAAKICQNLPESLWPGLDDPSAARITALSRRLPEGL